MTDSTFNLTDLLSAAIVEVQIDSTGKLWVNIEGRCALRIAHVERLVIDQWGTNLADRSHIVQDYGPTPSYLQRVVVIDSPTTLDEFRRRDGRK